MFEAIPIRTNEVDDEWADRFFADAFAIRSQPVTILGAPSQTPATKKYIRSSALPAQLAEQVEQAYADVLGDSEFVSADAKLTHCAEVKVTHLGEDGGLLGRRHVDPGASSGDSDIGPARRVDSADQSADGAVAQHGAAVLAG